MLRLRAGEAWKGVPAHHGVDLSALGQRREREGRRAEGAQPPGPAQTPGWTPPVFTTVAHRGKGVAELLEGLDRHRAWLTETGLLRVRRRERLAERVRAVVERRLCWDVWERRGAREYLEANLDVLERGEATPYGVADAILRRFAPSVSE